MNRFLKSEVRADLISRHRIERDGRIKDRIKAVLLYDKGWTYARIAEALFLSEEAIRKHVEDYINSEKLSPENGGSDSKLSNEQAKEICTYLEATTICKAKDIAQYVQEKYGIKYSISGITYWLKSQGFTYHKPAIVPAKADKLKQEKWVEDQGYLIKFFGRSLNLEFFHPSRTSF